ncbi:disease resistance protein RPV1-like [Syzygium oleosum]|uniref:disease resistance protein RPV1-like n=1 Tax=Syzygium oleosum TaxID=219896 RepID=UPI0024BBA46F|nr:disease resistance protein RPV1-like [Syzygium oleosum]
MASKLFPSLAATAFAAMLLYHFLKRRSREMNGGEANNNAAANDGTAGGASSAHTSTEGQGMATSSGYDYEVFLSFRGPDTRATFTDFLYTSLIDAGIRAFKDDEDLRKGEEFASELLQAINQSKISIPIFSKGYASSVWCLKELVQMVKCQKTRGQKIMPVFYDVAPLEVRHQTGGYGEAFLSHENKKRYDEETMREWKAALKEVSFLNGWELPTRREAAFTKTLTQKVFNELKKAYLVVSNNLVNVDQHVDEIMEMIGIQTSQTQIIGIYGMGGIGKTTIAKIIYNKLSNNFEDCCFLSNIREMSKLKGMECLQTQLISDILKTKWIDIKSIDEGTQTIKDRLSNKRILLLLDDVDEDNHMDALVGERDWFGTGSKLIITTRKKDVLDVPVVDCRYEVNCMDRNQSLQLFSKHAFRRDYPLDEYINQSKKAIDIAGGLPLALEVIGSLLSRIPKKKWDFTLKKLDSVPDAKIQKKLKISYDALDVREKHIFLDIACFFIGYNKDIMVHFWDEGKLFLEEAMEVLQNMSLIKINEDNEVWMHDQLRDLGREMVRQESNMKIEKQNRVWNPKEALVLLRRHEGKQKVEALRLKFDHQWQYCFTLEDLMRLSNLRFLEIDGSMENFCAEERLLWHELPSNVIPTNDYQENSNLLPQLQWLSWHNIPPTFNITIFSMENMVIVDLSGSKITHDWNGWSRMKVIKNLRVLNLTDCYCLKRTPNFSAHANLERLILWGCTELIEIDRSICQLKRLVSLDVRHCRNLQRLPYELGGELTSLEYLSLEYCLLLKRLPDSIGNLELLIELDISNTNIGELPDSIRNLKNLKVVKMTGSAISIIPDALWTMEKLEKIEAAYNHDLHVEIGNGIYRSPSLRILKLSCAEIYAVPRLPASLLILHLSTLSINTFPDLSNLMNLKELYLRFGPCAYDVKSYELVEDSIPGWIGKLSKLESLSLYYDYVTTLPTNIGLLPQLKALNLGCSNLRCLPRVPSNLLSLLLYDCRSLLSMDLSNLRKLSSLAISSSAISEIRGLDRLENVQDLRLSNLGQVEKLTGLSNLNKLRSLQVLNCGKLVEIQGELPKSLEELGIFSCDSLQKLPDLLSLKRLQKVDIIDCMKLNVEAILGFAQSSRAYL